MINPYQILSVLCKDFPSLTKEQYQKNLKLFKESGGIAPEGKVFVWVRKVEDEKSFSRMQNAYSSEFNVHMAI